ncbi:MAG: DUF3047 domain-containing protein [Nitrospinota bacterium]
MAGVRIQIFAFLFTIVFIPSAFTDGNSIIIDDFESGIKKGWERKDFEGKTLYTVIKEKNGYALKAVSIGSATGLIYRYKYDVREYPILTWRWKVENIIKKGNAYKKEGDDYAARVYVIFPHWFPFQTKSINYVWANKLPKGGHTPNTYYKKSILVAVESGPENIGKWITEERNVYEDYKKLFGGEPRMAGGVAIMTDTDQTGERAVAYYDDIRLKKAP